MSNQPLNETELAEIRQLAQGGEKKLREMSNRATIMAEKWRIKAHACDPAISKPESKITS